MHTLLFVACLLITFATSALLVRIFLLPVQRTVAGIGLLVFWLATLIVPMQCLAATSHLDVRYLVGAYGLVFACVAALWWQRKRLGLVSERAAVEAEPHTVIAWHVRIGLVIVAGVYGVLAARLAFSFPDNWDAVVYHYPVALRWLQEATLQISSSTKWQASLPGNVELLDVLVLFTGQDRYLPVMQWPGLVLLVLACRYLSRRVDESAAATWPVVTTVLMIPMVANQATSGYVDLFCSACLFASVALVFEYYSQWKDGKGAARLGLLAAAGLACGMAVGAKPVYWLYCSLLFSGTLFLLVRQGRNRRQFPSRQIAVLIAAVTLPALFWFVRALVYTGNPVYPFALHIGSLTLAGVRVADITDPNYYLSYVRHWSEWFIYPWIEWKSAPGFLGTNYTPGDGLGGGFATFIVPGVLFSGWLALRRRPALRVWLAVLAVVAVLWWFFLQKVGRFGLPMFILAILLSAPFFQLVEYRATRIYRCLYIAVFAITAAILVFEPLYTIAQTVRYRTWSRAAYFRYPEAIDTLQAGSRILNLADEPLNYALAGSGLTNRVVASWEVPPRLTAEFLRSRQIDYVVERIVTENGAAAVERPMPVVGLELYFQSRVKDGETGMAEWRIWSTGRLRASVTER